jgi:hypothetical protein
MTITDPAEYRRIHDIAAAAYEAAVPVDYRYSALALRKAVDAALSTTEPGKPESGVLAEAVKVTDEIEQLRDRAETAVVAANALQARLDAAEERLAGAGWQPIATAPKDGAQIIGRTTHEQVFACNWFWDDEEETEGDWLEYGTDVVRPKEWLAMPRSSSPAAGASTLLKRMSDAMDHMSPDDTIGYTNGSFWIDVATVEEIRNAAYPEARRAKP